MSSETALTKVRNWLMTYSQFSILDNFKVDYTDQIPSNGGIFPSGLTEVSRTTDILGGVQVVNQYNFGIYYVFSKAPGIDTDAVNNQEWLADFQSWVQEQSVKGLAPTFGDEPKTEVITAQNGVLYDATDEGLGTYMVQLSIQFKKFF